MPKVWTATLTDEEWDKLTDKELDELCEKLDEAWRLILQRTGLT